MSKFSKDEIEAEHRRRRRMVTERTIGTANAECIHCGRPFDATMAVAGAHGLCDDCNLRD